AGPAITSAAQASSAASSRRVTILFLLSSPLRRLRPAGERAGLELVAGGRDGVGDRAQVGMAAEQAQELSVGPPVQRQLRRVRHGPEANRELVTRRREPAA